MVAIPAFLLASSAVTHLGPLWPRNSVVRSPEPIPEPLPNPQTPPAKSADDPFGSVLGPIVGSNFPDPAIIAVDGISYAFATNNRGVGAGMIHVQMATSSDNQTWTLLDGQDALPHVGTWETGNRVWAPDVVQVDDGSFVLYYADEPTWSPSKHCVGVATSKTVTGPYIPASNPLACPDVDAVGGAIDPDGFHDLSTNKRYITYKVDGNSIGHGGLCMNSVAPIVPTPIMLQEVDADGVTLIGSAVEILDRDDFDGPLIEAPSLYRSAEGIYFLFFSSNCFTTPLYDISYATATTIDGPYVKASRPLTVTGDGPNLVGPGGLDIIKDGSMVLFHGHLTVGNDASIEQEADALAAKSGKPVKDVAVPFVRGMYSGVATFSGRTVSLA